MMKTERVTLSSEKVHLLIHDWRRFWQTESHQIDLDLASMKGGSESLCIWMGEVKQNLNESDPHWFGLIQICLVKGP